MTAYTATPCPECYGTGVIDDPDQCGDPDHCPGGMTCLVCAGTGTDDDVIRAASKAVAQWWADEDGRPVEPPQADDVRLAKAVVAAVAERIAARALREAADDVERTWTDATHHVMPGVEKVRVNWSSEVSKWLRARAEQVET